MRWKHPKDDVWLEGVHKGELKDGKLHGQGYSTFFDGNKYVGEWKNGKLHGQGTFTWADGVEYVGEFKDDNGTDLEDEI